MQNDLYEAQNYSSLIKLYCNILNMKLKLCVNFYFISFILEGTEIASTMNI